MNNKKKDLSFIFKEFIEFASKEDIWFSMDSYSLLGAIKYSGFVPSEEKNQIMMTVDSYNKLRRLAPSKIVSSLNDKTIKKFKSFYVKDNKSSFYNQPFIEIRILCPTTIKRIKNFYSFKSKTKDFFKRKIRNLNKAINDLQDQKFEGYLLLESEKQDINKNWIQTLSFKTVNKKFNGLSVPVIQEYEEILSKQFGANYMNSDVLNVSETKDELSEKKEKENKQWKQEI
ncbi:MAG: hypothetical protein HRT99_00250 [Mycoplasmatales bacterium]|nr:hypothetical protein [Mycoplasmatales bacterium]